MWKFVQSIFLILRYWYKYVLQLRLLQLKYECMVEGKIFSRRSFDLRPEKCYDTFVCIYVFVVYLGGLNIFEGRFRYSSKYV